MSKGQVVSVELPDGRGATSPRGKYASRGHRQLVAASELTGRRRPTVTRQVVEALVELLRRDGVEVGDKLPSEWELVEQLGVGRSAVREAVRELATLELVEVRRGLGTFVRSLKPELLLRADDFGSANDTGVLRELLEVRTIIEPAAAALAAVRREEDDLRRLDQDVARLAEAVNLRFRPPEDLGFHLDVVRTVHNQSLTRVVGVITSFYEHDTAVPTQRDVVEHAAILDAIRRSDPEGASQAMAAHLEQEKPT